MVTHDEQQGDPSTPSQGGPGRIELMAVTDPVEGAFTVHLPVGWDVQARSVRPYGVHRVVVNARSPDGGTFLFFTDPQLPTFVEPAQAIPGMPPLPLSQVSPYVPAEPFFVGYLQQRYRGAAGLRITAAEPAPALVQQVLQVAQERGRPVAVATAVRLSFTFQDQGKPVMGRLHGATFSTGGVWVADVSCALTTVAMDPARWDDLLYGIARSLKSTPQWRQQQDQQHQQRMAQIDANHRSAVQQMQAQHHSNMGWIQQSAQAHQQRMDTLHHSHDAQLQGWYAQQAGIDGGHRRFLNDLTGVNAAAPTADPGGDFNHRRHLNLITEQETVVAADGSTYQVEAGHQRYYKHKRDDSYLGTDSSVDVADLRARFGVNPDDYEEVRVKR